MLQFFTRSGEYIKTIESHGFSQFKYNDVNSVSINENPEPLLGSVVFVYLSGHCVGSGLVTGYNHRKNENLADLSIFPRTLDLGSEFVREGSYNADIADVIADLLEQYRLSVSTPVLYLKEKNLTGVRFKFSFEAGKTIREAWDFVVKKFLKSEFCLIIENDGGVVVRRAGALHNLTFGNDILRIEYEKDASEIVNFVKFTNGKGLELSHSDVNSVARYGKQVMHISDERFSHREAVIEYIERIFERKSSPVIRIESLVTLRDDIQVFDKISISNWEKNLPDNLVVNSVAYLSNGLCSLDVGTSSSREEEMGEI